MATTGTLRIVDGTDTDPALAEHRHSFTAFRHLVLFAALHMALTLGCVALAFLGNSKLVAFLLWLGGTLAMVAILATHNANASAQFVQSHN